MRVVRELTASRSKLVAGKSVMAERFAELQAEYIKVLRIAELSRAASRSNLAKADKATNLAKQVCSSVTACRRAILKQGQSLLCKRSFAVLHKERYCRKHCDKAGREDEANSRHHLCTFSH